MRRRSPHHSGGGRRPAARPPSEGAIEREVSIERLGAGGDGVARLDGSPLFVPWTLPGERWLVRIRPGQRHAEPLRRLSGPPRAEPVCPHFGRCGGCALQHLPAADYRAFKEARVLEPLARAGLRPAELLPTACSPPGSRRRLRAAFVRRPEGRTALGFCAPRSHRIEPIERCPIARPELEAVLRSSAGALDRLPLVQRAGHGEVSLALFEAGVDLVLHVAVEPGLADREALVALAAELDTARLALARPGGPVEPILVRRPPRLVFGSVVIEPPPLAFLQATAEGEAALRAAVARWVPAGARLVDLFAGLGTLSLPLLDRLDRLLLVEADAAMVAAVGRATATRPRARVERRDLARAPLDAVELSAFDVVLLDPPRAGAAAQCAVLARAAVDRIVYASCDPGTFARDARILTEGGFRLRALQPIDQFLWSAEMELVALFERAPSRRSAPP